MSQEDDAPQPAAEDTSSGKGATREGERTPQRPRIELPTIIVEDDDAATPTSANPGSSPLARPSAETAQARLQRPGGADAGPAVFIQNPDVGPLQLFTFGGGEGLCVVKPHTAARVSGSIRGPFSPAETHHGHPQLFRVASLPGRGQCLIATRNIEAGTFVFREQPLLVACMDTRFDSTIDLSILKPAKRGALLSLHNSARGIPGMDGLRGIVATNAVGVPLPPEGDDHLAVCESVSRINHSCTPNARYYWDYSSFSVGLVATKHIKAGHEITITYVDPFLPHLDREAHLLSNYGFTCDCLACQPQSPTYRLSETIRTTVNNLLPDADGEGDDELVRWGGTTKAFVQRILNMLEVEGLQGERAEVIVRFAEFEERLGNRERAQRMARWALRELGKIECEDASPDWAAMREIIRDSSGSSSESSEH